MSKREDYAGVWSCVGAVVMGLAGCVSCLNHPYRFGEFPMTLFNLITGAVMGALIGAAIGATTGYYRDRELQEIYARERREAEAVAKRERLNAEAVAKASARDAALAKLKRLVAEVRRAASSLPIILGKVEIALDRAQDELASGLYSPFWEAIEGQPPRCSHSTARCRQLN